MIITFFWFSVYSIVAGAHPQTQSQPQSQLQSQPQSNVVKFRCDICHINLKDSIACREHMKNHAAEPKKCPHCNKTSTNLVALQKHMMREHGGMKSYKCPFCQETFETAKLCNVRANGFCRLSIDSWYWVLYTEVIIQYFMFILCMCVF